MSDIESSPVAGQNGQANAVIPLVFMKETALFGDRLPSKQEWLSHVELFTAISKRIDSSHITGLQRVRGLWRIYIDNLQDKVSLMEQGVPLRGKIIPVLNTNPQRLDGENSLRIRIKNIPLSADDGVISRVLTFRGIEVIAINRDKLRVNGKLANCETGDRLVVVKTTSLKDPLPYFMVFGMFTARVLHAGQTTGDRTVETKCSKCLQSGHMFSQCVHDWVCRKCNKPGHKEPDCVVQDENDTDDSESDSEEEQASSTAVPQSPKPAHSVEIKQTTSLNTPRPKRQPFYG